MSRRVMFLRGSNNHPVGCAVIQLNKNDTVSYQVSVLNPMDKFNRSVARQLAIGRLVESPITIAIDCATTMHNISHLVMEDIVERRAHNSIPTRAVRAARKWMIENA